MEGNQLPGSEMKDVGFHFPARRRSCEYIFLNSFIFVCRGSSLLLEDSIWLLRVVAALHSVARASLSGGFSCCER